MNVKEYIASGTLELYALNSLSDREMKEVEALAAQYPEIAAELEKVTAAMEEYAFEHAVEPPKELKTKVLSAISAQPRQQEAVVKELPGVYKFLAAACILGIVLSGITTFNLFGKLKSAKEEIGRLSSSNEKMVQDMKDMTDRYNTVNNNLQVAQGMDYKSVLLKAAKEDGTGMVRVYWNDKTKETFIHVMQLQDLPAGKQYQLWALVDGKPVDAGMLDMQLSMNGMQKVKNVENAQSFAITIEKEGGSPVPTLSELQVIGNV